VDPTCQGYVLHNYIWNSNVPPIRAGGEIYFIMKKMEAYSLSHLNNQVWEYGEKPEPPHATTVVSFPLLILSTQSIDIAPPIRLSR
jgi:hypothetical protein